MHVLHMSMWPDARRPSLDGSRVVQPCPACPVRHRVRCAESLSGCGWPPILRPMRRHPIDPIVTAEPELPIRPCEHPGCEAGGDFRAPRSRLELNRYYWFCLEHVRAYNLAWNYYAGMSDSEIEAEIRRDTVWQRPSWRLGERHGPGPRIHDGFGFYAGNGHDRGRRRNGHSGGQARDAAARAASACEQ